MGCSASKPREEEGPVNYREKKQELNRRQRHEGASGRLPVKICETQKHLRPRVLGIIPARFGSTRFPGKPLADLAGKPMIWHTYTNACKSRALDLCIVATDDQRIKKVVESFGGICVMTSSECANGTERCLEVYESCARKGEEYDVIVNIQGDEPFIEPEHIDLVAKIVCESEDADVCMGTLCRPAIDRKDVEGVNNVKVVVDKNMNALYFSRAIIPHNKLGQYDPETNYLRKLGIYSYRADFLPKYCHMPESHLQIAEDLEQNKVIEAGYKIKLAMVKDAVHGVDTVGQLEALNLAIERGELKHRGVKIKKNKSFKTQF
jgi:3-deoxy-manno-octulosonate cytidylyltransferase (CMP-KDO synthetase)